MIGSSRSIDYSMRGRVTHLLIAILLGSLLSATGVAAASDARIVGGTAPTRAWPANGHVAAVVADGAYFCSGTLISGRWFLTAAQCVTNTDGSVLAPSAFTISLGKTDLNQVTALDRFSVDAVQRHPSYVESPVPSYDMALLHLASPPPFEPTALVTSAQSGLWAPGAVATIIGWGALCNGCAPVPQLREAPITMVSDSACTSAYGNAFNIMSMVCAGSGTAGSCAGDAGGPLLVPRQGDFLVAGITSWGQGCADAAHPAVYARTGRPVLNQWLRDRIPAAAMSYEPLAPQPTNPLYFTATSVKPASQSGAPTYRWDLDGDCAFDDATGATASLSDPAQGYRYVRVQVSYPDGDRAIAKERVKIGNPPSMPPAPICLPPQTPPPPPPPLPPPPPPPVTPPPPPPGVPPPPPPPGTVPPPPPGEMIRPPASPTPQLARLVNPPSRVSVASLTDGKTSVRVQCMYACSLNATLRFKGSKLGAGNARWTSARTSVVTIKLTRAAIKKLRKTRKGSIGLAVTATTGSRLQKLDGTMILKR